jgi:hypothetical protein
MAAIGQHLRPRRLCPTPVKAGFAADRLADASSGPRAECGRSAHSTSLPHERLTPQSPSMIAFALQPLRGEPSPWRHSASRQGRPRRRPATALRPEGPCCPRVRRCRDCPEPSARCAGYGPQITVGLRAEQPPRGSVRRAGCDRKQLRGTLRLTVASMTHCRIPLRLANEQRRGHSRDQWSKSSV